MTLRFRSKHLATLALAATALLGACSSSDSDGATDPDVDVAFRVTALTENMACAAGSCGVDLRGSVRTMDGQFVSGASVWTYVNGSTTVGQRAITNGNGAYITHLTIPSTFHGTYSVRVCSGTVTRPVDGDCPQVNLIFS